MLKFAFVKSKANKKLLKALGKRIKALRMKQNISQSQLAFESGLHRDQIGRIELGKQNSSISTLEAIATAFSIGLKELLDFDY
jgi:transcriptional regulator with XRE-family HTH domain